MMATVSVDEQMMVAVMLVTRMQMVMARMTKMMSAQRMDLSRLQTSDTTRLWYWILRETHRLTLTGSSLTM